jgi:hypothetical protein
MVLSAALEDFVTWLRMRIQFFCKI